MMPNMKNYNMINVHEDLLCTIEDIAYWVANNLNKTPLIFRNSKLQKEFYKLVEEYKEV